MFFTSVQFFVFFITVAVAYFLFPQKIRTFWLLLVSLGFYATFDWRFIFLLVFDSLVAYGFALAISRTEQIGLRKICVTVSGVLIFGLLAYFKYFNFFNDSVRMIAAWFGIPYLVPHLSILLPVGISFYSFQLFGYIMDVYKNKCDAEKNIVVFGVFASFFPQTASGPIGRAPALLPQIRQPQNFSSADLLEGGQLILWGLFKKVVVADRLAAYVNSMFFMPETHSGISLLLAVYLFTFQIYCDFSGYSDIAIGCARILGYRLMLNFDLPYFSHNISEFWKKWHISLSSWFGSYLYIPLGGNRVPYWRWLCNIWIVFLVSGLWHGASWTFIIWGALHAFFYFIAYAWKKAFPNMNLWNWLKIVITFNAVAFAWIFFRAADFHDALTVISRIFTHWGCFEWSGSLISVYLMFPMLAIMLLVEFTSYFGILAKFKNVSGYLLLVKIAGFSLLGILIALFGVSQKSFIYLQF